MFSDVSGEMAERRERESLLHRSQPHDVLPAASVHNQHLLLPHLATSQPAPPPGRAAAEDRQDHPEVQSQSGQDADDCDSPLRILLVASLFNFCKNQTRRADRFRV